MQDDDTHGGHKGAFIVLLNVGRFGGYLSLFGLVDARRPRFEPRDGHRLDGLVKHERQRDRKTLMYNILYVLKNHGCSHHRRDLLFSSNNAMTSLYIVCNSIGVDHLLPEVRVWC